MSKSETHPTGRCMCGAIRYELVSDPIAIIYCHCESCRRHTGAPTSALAGMRRDDVRFTQGERAIYESSPGVGRGFCRDCGTTLTWEGDGPQILRSGRLLPFWLGGLELRRCARGSA